ncbi:hypothetical protein KIH86_02335 [Paenibacillus sp. HN-1]|uniref:hypothetical protein n=1 Tax=Paenibacillus TaxID=44249 RepID=UPI001CA830E6|nr:MULTISPECIES: hypothetical protein [Paenibacillus]MBY9080271.1 hypothetical protein [Paenibacillus sp. CGMCC 1.18879]MBY9083070.1 hypothetical protein [Paenibacillus sinensis]
MVLTQEEQQEIIRWMYRNARPLELAHWRFHFEDGSAEDVLKALSAFQNKDGGFGHALEADSWNPESSPLQTSTAALLLLELQAPANHHIVQGILRYLDSGDSFEGGKWKLSIPSNNDYPHAPWWHTSSLSEEREQYNPTAILAGFILKYGDRGSVLHAKGTAIAKELVSEFLRHPEIERHPLECVNILLECLESSDQVETDTVVSTPLLKEAVLARMTQVIERNPARWGEYTCRPSIFIKSRQSPLYEANRELLRKELTYLAETREPGGVWKLNWRWAEFPEAFAISEIWWKARVVIENMLVIRAFDE